MRSNYNSLITLLLGIVLVNTIGFSQPVVDWSENYGGFQPDVVNEIEQTPDGGFIIVGWTGSIDGDVSGNNGGSDAWIVKIDQQGTIEWEKNYGGSDNDGASAVKLTADGGFIVVGNSRSNDGDVGANNGLLDSWVIKLDNEGNLEWSQNYGGSGNDSAVDVVEADSGYTVLSYSHSTDGDVGENNGLRDFWIIKLSDLGIIEWEHAYGGSTFETPSSIEIDTNGGYMIAGFSGSADGDVGANNGSNDTWLVKLDNLGNLQWENNYGGSDNDVSYHMEQTSDGGYVLAGRSKSNDGDSPGNNGEHDCWIFKLSATGMLEWTKSYGGSQDDEALSIKETPDGKYLVAGVSLSNDGDVGGNFGAEDSWILKLGSTGDLEWERNYGGSGLDEAMDIEVITNDDFLIANRTESSDGDVEANYGNADIWLLSITSDPNSIQTLEPNPNVTIYPNPSNGQLTVDIKESTGPMTVKIYNAAGRELYRENHVNRNLSITDLPKGNYYIQIVSDEFSFHRKLIVH